MLLKTCGIIFSSTNTFTYFVGFRLSNYYTNILYIFLIDSGRLAIQLDQWLKL